MYRYECPGCGNVIISKTRDYLDCPKCETTLDRT